MPTDPRPGTTDFSKDVLGRYVCNGFDEAKRSTEKNVMRPDGRPQIEARDFDLIVIGGGTFGAVVAEHMAFRDRARQHRILVLEGGPFLLGEHVQNLPVVGLDPGKATSIKDLRNNNQFGPDKPQREVWGLPWHSPVPFPGLAYCVGGRSLYWGGWSPEPLASELPAEWPDEVLADLTAETLPDGSNGYFRQAAGQIGTTETNDFIFGELHRAVRTQLLDALRAGSVTDALSLPALPDHPSVRYSDDPPTLEQLASLLGLPPGELPASEADAREELKLEAPLAVQGRNGHAGFFPFNKFSTVPLLIKATREAAAEAGLDDARKRLMVVPNCHVKRLISVKDADQWRVIEIDTDQGPVPVPVGGKVVIALGTIETTRLIQESFKDLPAEARDRIGTNLMAHLRSNLDIRFPRENLKHLSPAVNALQASALFVKGRHTFQDGVGHFHLQITVSGLGTRGGHSEAELFKKIPDIDLYDAHKNANDTHVVMTIRGIGEMQPHNPHSRIIPDAEPDEWAIPRAFVSLANPEDPDQRAANPKTAKDFELWEAMDAAAMDVARAFGVNNPPAPSHDVLGTTHHESGTLFMGEENSTSVTLPDCRLRHVHNAYVAGPALYPTIGSPNPMLGGVALGRRLADRLATSTPDQPDPGFQMLFDGIDAGTWRMTTIRNQPGRHNPGSFRILNGALETVAGSDMGVFWCTIPTPPDFILKLEWLRWTEDSNSGVYLRFPDPESKGYNNTAYVADDFGFEVQIDELGAPDGSPIHKTGAIYRKDGRTDNEILNLKPARPVGEWNDYEIRVQGHIYTVKLNGEEVCVFDNTNLYPNRGVPSAPGAPSFLGLQVYPNPRYFVAFRRIQIRAL